MILFPELFPTSWFQNPDLQTLQHIVFVHQGFFSHLFPSRISAKLLYNSASNSDSFFSGICRPSPLVTTFPCALHMSFWSLHSPYNFLCLLWIWFSMTPRCRSRSHIWALANIPQPHTNFSKQCWSSPVSEYIQGLLKLLSCSWSSHELVALPIFRWFSYLEISLKKFCSIVFINPVRNSQTSSKNGFTKLGRKTL